MTGAGVDQLVLFVHIPKTAGTTLSVIMEQRYGPGAVCTLRPERLPERIAELAAMPEAAQRKLAVIKGHMTFGLHELLAVPSTYMTMLRDPVDRVLSAYRHYCRHPEVRIGGIIRDRNLDLEGYLDLTDEILEPDNRQTRFLAGVGEPSSLGWTLPHGGVDEAILDRARRNLDEHFAVVGITERFDESLVVISESLGWTIASYDRQTVAPDRDSRPPVPGHIRDRIERLNRFDRRLYEHGRTRLEARIAELGPRFRAGLDTLRTAGAV